MKTRFLLILVLVMLLSMAVPFVFPQADVLWEPENDFYSRNRDKCVVMSRSFYANGEGGFLSIKTQPGANREVFEFKNGDILYIQFTYDYKGEIWGVTEFYDPESLEQKSGWAPMDQLLVVYDYMSFHDDHKDEIYEYTGGVESLYEVGDIAFWTWPGSGELAWILQDEWRNPESDSGFLTPYVAYKDEEGREWAYFSYVYGTRNSWVCMDDPSNLDIPAFNAEPEPVLRQPGDTPPVYEDDEDDPYTSYEDDKKSGDDPSGLIEMSPFILVIILVAGVALVSVTLILLFWNRKKAP